MSARRRYAEVATTDNRGEVTGFYTQLHPVEHEDDCNTVLYAGVIPRVPCNCADLDLYSEEGQ
ncbi:hypothetical protein [Streptomyces sp. NPDC004726]